MRPVERFRAAHEEWREANIAEDKALAMFNKAENRYEKARQEMGAARVALISAVMDGSVVDAGIGGDE